MLRVGAEPDGHAAPDCWRNGSLHDAGRGELVTALFASCRAEASSHQPILVAIYVANGAPAGAR
jgi:hypothetical protein